MVRRHVRTGKAQISLRIRAVWSESFLFASKLCKPFSLYTIKDEDESSVFQ